MRRVTIGVFDSGVGGLTVLRELAARIPDADRLAVAGGNLRRLLEQAQAGAES